jgi:tetratricopeptide (TPR) repeat protein
MWKKQETSLLEKEFAELKAQLVKEPKDVVLREQIANCCLKLRRFNEAEEYFRELVTEFSGKAKYYYHLAKVYGAQERWVEAIEQCNKALERWSEFQWAKMEKAKCLLGKKETDAAYELLIEIEGLLSNSEKDKVLALNVYRALYVLKVERNDPGGALSVLMKLAELEPEDGFTFYRMGKLHLELKDYGKALNDFQVSDPLLRKPYVKDKIAVTLTFLGREDEALDVYKNISPNQMDDYIHQHYGRLLLKRGEYDLAKEQLKRAIVKKGMSKFNAHFFLGQVFEKLGKHRNARREYERAMELRQKEFAVDFPQAEDRIRFIDQNVVLDEAEVIEEYSNRLQGRIMKFVSERGFGFIKFGKGEDVFVHVKACNTQTLRVMTLLHLRLSKAERGLKLRPLS